MPLTKKELALRAIIALDGMYPGQGWLLREAEAELAIDLGLRDFSEAMARDERRALLQQDYSVTLSSGIGNPITATGSLTSAADVLFESIRWGAVVDADGNMLTHVEHYNDFRRFQQPGYKYFTLHNQRIYVRSAASGDYTTDLGDVNGPLTVTANFIATATTVPAELTDEATRYVMNALLRLPGVIVGESVPAT